MEKLKNFLNYDFQFSSNQCSLVLSNARSQYLTNLPNLYNQKTHQKHVS